MLDFMDSTDANLLCAVVETALGPLTVTERNGAIVRLRFGREGGGGDSPLLRDRSNFTVGAGLVWTPWQSRERVSP